MSRKNIIVTLVIILMFGVLGGYIYLQNKQLPFLERYNKQIDDHGCLISAGYSWCEIKQRCLNLEKESCDIAGCFHGNIEIDWLDNKATDVALDVSLEELIIERFKEQAKEIVMFQMIVFVMLPVLIFPWRNLI